jgi:hypothetical protein
MKKRNEAQQLEFNFIMVSGKKRHSVSSTLVLQISATTVSDKQP